MGQTLRCAIYTRKSSEEGLEQGFNSLHAQREACEAYVLSQAGEGWIALKAQYDDGGFSGGSMERPGLKALLADIAKGLIDVVVVYKVDRLTRSLSDFAKIVEAFDQQGVSFVSVTQAFNTTTSMGRLTLNVLLSFAQFEREVTGERIRDKIAASKKKGMWMGGIPPLGYDLPRDLTTRALLVNPVEAETVRLIFKRYLELDSVHELLRWLYGQKIRSKAWTTREGDARGGKEFSRGALFYLLKNNLYVGEIRHKGQSHPGAHPPIIDPEVFDAVQRRLDSKSTSHLTRTTKVSTMMLRGLVFDADGVAMSPTFTHGEGGRVYRYYVSTVLQQGQARDPQDQTIRRVPAHTIESIVRECLEQLTGKPAAILAEVVSRVEIHSTTVQLLINRAACFKRASDPQTEFELLSQRMSTMGHISPEPSGSDIIRVTLPRKLNFKGRRVWISNSEGSVAAERSTPDKTLIQGLQAAHQLLAQSADQAFGRPEHLEIPLTPKSSYERDICRLAFLAPDIQVAILEGRQPSNLTLQLIRNITLPALWQDQRKVLGFPC